MSDIEPIAFRPRQKNGSPARGAASTDSTYHASAGAGVFAQVCFNRRELDAIMEVYGRQVAAGEWRDYAIDFGRDKAVFSIFRRTSEVPLYRVEKNPKLARKQGAFSILAANGLVLKRGPELKRVLGVLEKTVKLVGR